MILRWIVERSSGGSARPRGGPGPPIAGFVMVCPWHLRYPSHPGIPGLYINVESFGTMSLYISFFLQSGVEILNGELTIHKVQQTDSGMYQCVGENKYGAIYSSAELKILGSHIVGVNNFKNWRHCKGKQAIFLSAKRILKYTSKRSKITS